MAGIEKRVHYSGGVLGPLTKDDLITARKFIDRTLKEEDEVDENTAKVLAKVDEFFEDRINEAVTVGKVF